MKNVNLSKISSLTFTHSKLTEARSLYYSLMFNKEILQILYIIIIII